MAWHSKQKALVHIYADAARLADAEYRQLIQDVAGCRSAAFPSLTQWHFDQVMARIEGLLDYRVAEGIVPRPAEGKISTLNYWRRRLPESGGQNARQIHKVRELWAELCPRLPEEQRTDEYLNAIAGRACGARVRSIWELKAWQAAALIDALRDRLHYAVRRDTVEA